MKTMEDLSCSIDGILKAHDHKIYAHPDELLSEHIERCRRYFDKINEEKDIKQIVERYADHRLGALPGETMKLVWQMFLDIIEFHDVGKVSPEFQREKMKNQEVPDSVLIDDSARHAMLSAVIYLESQYDKIKSRANGRKQRRALEKIAILNAYVISRHHGRMKPLRIFFDDMRNGYGEKVLSALSKGKLKGCELKNIDVRDFVINPESDVRDEKERYDGFDYFYCRLAHSVLVACDYYATNEYGSGIHMTHFGNVSSPETLIADYESASLQKSIRAFEKDKYGRISVEKADDINELRSMMFLDAERAYQQAPDEHIYFAEMPTGSGKSNMAFNVSMKMLKNGAGKLFYIYPFNNLVEQNRSTVEKLLSRERYSDVAVVNSLTPIKHEKDEEENGKYYESALLDRQFLNYPVIMSTHVSFFDMLFGVRRESTFGFYQLCNAVVVLDEIQSYRNEIWGEMMIMLQDCAKLLNMKMIIMSATLPDLTYLSGSSEGVKHLIHDADRYYMMPVFRERVEISTELLKDDDFSLETLRDHIVENHGRGKRILVEFMYKKTADEFYSRLQEDEGVNIPVLCITGDDSVFQREKILKPIKDNEIEECILVSTQVLEAGADIDMDIGYKNISRLDSEEQFMGRINRSCRKTGKAYFFMIDDPAIIYRDDFRMDPSLTLLNDEMERVLREKDFRGYYGRVMDKIRENHMEKTNEAGIEEFRKNELGALDFKGVEAHFRLIENDALAQNVFLSRRLDFEDGNVLDGLQIWSEYKELLRNEDMPFAEKKVKLSESRAKMAPFIYQIRPKCTLYPDDEVGDLMFYENGDEFFKDGRLDRAKLEKNDSLFY